MNAEVLAKRNKVLLSKGNKILIVSTLLNFITGVLYIWSLISNELIYSYNWTSKEASVPYTVYTIFSGIGMLIFGVVQEKKGPRFCCMLAGILIGTGFIISGLFIHPQVYLLSVGVLLGLGVGNIMVASTPTAVRWFSEENKGKVTGIAVAGVGLAPLFYSPVVRYIVGVIGLSKTLIYIGIIILILTVSLSHYMVLPPSSFNRNGESSIVNRRRDCNWRQILKSISFYKLWIMFAANSAAGLLILSHISNISKIQFNWDGGFILIILVSIFNTIGRILGGVLSDRIDKINLARTILIIQSINMLMLFKFNTIPYIIIGVVLGGFCYGAGFSVYPSKLSDLYGVKYFGTNYAILFLGWSLGGILGPAIAATIFDITNAYKLAYLFTFGLLIFSVILSLNFKSYEID